MNWVDGHDQFIGKLMESKKMATYQGYYKHTQYFKVEVEANSIEEARDKMWDVEIDWSGCSDMDNDIVEVEEIKNE